MGLYLDRARLLYDISQDSHSVVVCHVFKVNIIDLEDHVPRLNPAIQGYSSTLHDAADIDTAVTSLQHRLSHQAQVCWSYLVTLSNN